MKRFSLIIFIMILAGLLMPQISYSQISLPINKTNFKTENKDGFGKAMESVRRGDEYFESQSLGGYNKAIDEYLSAYTYNPKCAELNYKIGVCYLFSQEKKKAIFLCVNTLYICKT